jgi:Ca2+-binding EF-hand superfamily protein
MSTALFATIGMVSGTSFAAEPSVGLMAFDADNDGSVSHLEFVAEMKTRFDTIDKNRNGKVTQSELRSYGMKQMMSASKDPVFSRGQGRPDVPFDKKGEVDFAAFSQAMTRFRFDPVDADRDRILSAQEIKAKALR